MNIKVFTMGVLSIIVTAVTIVIITYHYYERTVPFEYVTHFPKFQNCYHKGFDYVKSEKRMYFFLVDFYKNQFSQEAGLEGYDSLFVSRIIKETNFDKYDYIISYIKKITSLKYSPHLTRTEDGLYFDKRIPLIAEYEEDETDFVYIYRIKKNKKFRAPGP